MVTWLFRQLLSIFDDDIGSDIGDERARPGGIPGQRDGSEPLPGAARGHAEDERADEGQRSVT